MRKRKWNDYTVHDEEFWRGLTWRAIAILILVCALGAWARIGS